MNKISGNSSGQRKCMHVMERNGLVKSEKGAMQCSLLVEEKKEDNKF